MKEVQHFEKNGTGFFYIEEDGKKIASMHYLSENSTLTIEHTVVDPAFEGQGLGKLLIKTITEFARTHSLKIVPVCPYAKKVMERSGEFQDVMK